MVRAIDKLAGLEWPEILVTALDNPHAEVRAAALKALGRYKDWVSQHEPLLFQMLANDPAWVVRIRALKSLGKWGSSAIVEPLMTAFKRDGAARREIVSILAGFEDDRVIDFLITALNERIFGVALNAAISLGQMSKGRLRLQQLATDQTAPGPLRQSALFGLRPTGHPSNKSFLLSFIENDQYDEAVRAYGVEVLVNESGSEIVDTETEEFLIGIFKDRSKNTKMRSIIARHLPKFNRIGLELLLEGLHDPAIREDVTNGLSKIGTKATKPLLLALQDKENDDVRIGAAKALYRLNTDAMIRDNNMLYRDFLREYIALVTSHLTTALEDEHELVRQIAQSALAVFR